jgi:lambda family phage portal protein
LPAFLAARRPGLFDRLGRLCDRVAGIFSPQRGLERIVARATLNQMEIFSNGQSGYDAGKSTTQTKGRFSSRINENAVPLTQVQRLRWQANDLLRNNPHARKVVRTLEAKVIGRGLRPQSHATQADGSPHFAFRERAQQLWRAVQNQIDFRGRPGRGGFSFVELQKQALRSIIMSGDLLWHMRPLGAREQAKQGLHIPLALQLIHTERLAEYLTEAAEASNPANRLFRGIELTKDGVPAAYWILQHHPSDPLMFLSTQEADRYDARDIGHLYMPDDLDQYRGVTWFATALLQMRDTADYQYNELKASALAACVALWYRRPTGAGPLGAALPSEWELADRDGNPITGMQPGMLMDLGTDGEVGGFNPARPNTNVAEFIGHMVRTISRALPGVKSSTLTGDYRRASFSSEKSEDNDVWPELEGLQDWFAGGFCQPAYEEVLVAGILAGYFAGVLSAGEFQERRSDLVAAAWQGPVARAINPTDDAKASHLRIQGGISTPQIECARVGLDWHENVKEVAEFIRTCTALGISADLIQQWLGIEAINRIQGDPQSAGIDEDTTAGDASGAPVTADDDEEDESVESPSQTAAA